MENFLEQMSEDFKRLAEEHRDVARTEHLWALGAPNNETAEMHEQNSEDHRMLANWYKELSNNPAWLAGKLVDFVSLK